MAFRAISFAHRCITRYYVQILFADKDLNRHFARYTRSLTTARHSRYRRAARREFRRAYKSPLRGLLATGKNSQIPRPGGYMPGYMHPREVICP